jgi:hypothetical protein
MLRVSEVAVLTGYVCPRTQLWRVPLVTTVRNENTDTLLLDHPRKHESLNVVYTGESTSITRTHINSAMSVVAHGNKYIDNVYKLPSIEPTIRYLHTAAGFPTKESWLRAIRRGNYNSWHLINIKKCCLAFPQIRGNPKRPHARTRPRCPFHQEEAMGHQSHIVSHQTLPTNHSSH